MSTKVFIKGIWIFLLAIVLQSCNIESENDLSTNREADNLKSRLIDRKIAGNFAENYLKGNYTLLRGSAFAKSSNEEDAREVIYPIEVLEDYIEYVQGIAGKDTYIGINMGQYPLDNIIDDRQNVAYKGYQTMFLMAYRSVAGSFSPISGISAMNHGSIIPPGHTFDILSENLENYKITDDAASILYKTYSENNEKILDDNGVEIKKQYFYDSNILKDYLNYVKIEAASNGITEINISINIGQEPFPTNTAAKSVKFGNQFVYLTASSKHDLKNTKLNSLENILAFK